MAASNLKRRFAITQEQMKMVKEINKRTELLLESIIHDRLPKAEYERLLSKDLLDLFMFLRRVFTNTFDNSRHDISKKTYAELVDFIGNMCNIITAGELCEHYKKISMRACDYIQAEGIK